MRAVSLFSEADRTYAASEDASRENADHADRKAADAWDAQVPVEKSAYLNDGDTAYINEDGFSHADGKLTHLDLFCGAGGFSVGCEMSGFESVAGIDHLQPAMETWCLNHPRSIGVLGDIRKIDPDTIKAKLEERGVDRINLLTGGVPCQGFSRANRKHNDNDERNFLFREYMRFVESFRPDYIILENVSGMRQTAGGRFENEIRSSMETLGYSVSVELLNAADYGVPQQRRRLLFVGVRKGSGLAPRYAFPQRTFGENGGTDGSGNVLGKYRTVADAISDLPHLGNGEAKTAYGTEPENGYQAMMRAGVEGDSLRNHEAPLHPAETVRRIEQTRPGQPMYRRFKQRIRLDPDLPSPTQLAGGIRPSFQFGHPTEPRGLSIRERARIQSFPDSYIFTGGICQERVQTGNAVPPLLVHAVTRPIAKDIVRRDGAQAAEPSLDADAPDVPATRRV